MKQIRVKFGKGTGETYPIEEIDSLSFEKARASKRHPSEKELCFTICLKEGTNESYYMDTDTDVAIEFSEGEENA